jgi:DNA-binding transcriptional LysR family regulator
MNLTYVETFYWATALRSVSDAAKRMHIVPQAAAARIRALEAELGVTLRDRRARVFRLTPAGERFMRDAERLLGLWREIRPTYRAQQQTPESLRIGSIEAVLHAWLLPWVEHERTQRAGLAFQLTSEHSSALHELMLRGALDLAITAEPAYDEGVRTTPLPALPMVFVGLRSLHEQSTYSLAELANYQLLTFQRGSSPYNKLHELLAENGLEDTPVHALSSVSAALRLVASGFGVATLPQAVLEDDTIASGFIALPCTTPLPDLPLYVSWRTDPASEALDTFAQSMLAFATNKPGEPETAAADSGNGHAASGSSHH